MIDTTSFPPFRRRRIRTAIYASDLDRALTTARNVAKQNRSDPAPPLTVSPLLREQFFGEAEGAPWDAGRYSSYHMPWEDHRAFKMADHAESLDDVARRADQVLRHFVLPHVVAAAASAPRHRDDDDDDRPQHVMLFAHGIWLSEFMFALKRAAEGPDARYVKTGGYANTGWSRVEIELVEDVSDAGVEQRDAGSAMDEHVDSTNEQVRAVPGAHEAGPESVDVDGTDEWTRPDPPAGMPSHIADLLPNLPPVPKRDERLPPPWPAHRPVPRIRMKVVALNQAEHLEGLKRTKGGVGSSAWDPKQKGIREFFGGGGGGGGAAPN